MECVALLSGGKDSCYNACHAVKQGYQLVGLATLSPEHGKDELDSYLYQTVGQDGIAFIAQAMQLPLYRHTIQGTAIDQSVDYQSSGNSPQDETEDLYQLLSTVLESHPNLKAVSVGAILSNYQRTRVEHVCRRLKLTCLAYMWQRDQSELMDEMARAGMESILIKVAGAGLETKHLGQNVFSEQMRATLKQLNDRFELHPCGEGGEYETFTLDCPLFRKRIELTKTEVVSLSAPNSDRYSTVAYLRIHDASLKDKQMRTEDFTQVTIPALLDDIASSQLDELRTLTISQDSDNEGNPALYQPEKGHIMPCQVTMEEDFYQITDLRVSYAHETSIEEEARACLELLKECLEDGGSSLASVSHINLFLSDMADFARVNSVYGSYFAISPPTRACVAVELPCRVSLEAFGRIEWQQRSALHVQSLSYWAPANIGPYSQAVCDGENVFIAGQIGLIPATLSLPCPQDLAMEMVLSYQHFTRILRDFLPGQSKKVKGAICWLVDQSWIAGKQFALVIWREAMPLEFRLARALPRGALVEWQISGKL